MRWLIVLVALSGCVEPPAPSFVGEAILADGQQLANPDDPDVARLMRVLKMETNPGPFTMPECDATCQEHQAPTMMTLVDTPGIVGVATIAYATEDEARASLATWTNADMVYIYGGTLIDIGFEEEDREAAEAIAAVVESMGARPATAK